VRVGDQANSSIEKHIQRGWHRTGTVVQSKSAGDFPYEVVDCLTGLVPLPPICAMVKDKT